MLRVVGSSTDCAWDFSKTLFVHAVGHEYLTLSLELENLGDSGGRGLDFSYESRWLFNGHFQHGHYWVRDKPDRNLL